MAKKAKKAKKVQLAILVFVGIFIAGILGTLALTYSRHRGYPIRFVRVVDAPTPLLMLYTRYKGYDSSSDDDYELRVIELETGIERGTLDIANRHDSQRPALFGPMGTKAWIYSPRDGFRLIDLESVSVVMTHEQIRQKVGVGIGGDLRNDSVGRVFDDATKRLKVIGRDGNKWLLTPDVEIEPYNYKKFKFSSRFDPCDKALRKLQSKPHKTPLLKPSMRACFGADDSLRGLVQHASADFGDTTYLATFFDASGQSLWTKDASKLVGAHNAWFAAARPNKRGLDLFIVSDRKLWRLDVEPDSGRVQSTRQLWPPDEPE